MSDAAKEIEKEKKAEEKAKRAEEKSKAKIFDEKDEAFCGFMVLSVIDSDGYKKSTKGCEMKAPVFMTSDGAAGDPVVLESEFAVNPLFYLAVPNDDDHLLFGKWWIGEKCSDLTQICSVVPKLCKAAHTQMDGGSKDIFTMEAEMPLLKNSPSRLITITCTTKEQKFVNKVTKVSVAIPRAYWTEWKNHRMRFWQRDKNAAGAGGGGGGGGGDDEKEEKKDEEKKE